MSKLAREKRSGTGASSFFSKYGLAIFSVLLGLLLGAIQPRFFAVQNLLNIVSSACTMGITGIGLTIILCSGEIDFACGMELTVSALVVGKLLDSTSFHSYPLAVAAALVVVVLFGLLNALMCVKVGIPAFIATMGTSFLTKGLVKWATDSSVLFSNRWPDSFTFLGQGYLFGVIPVPVLVLVVVGGIMWVYTELTRSGKLMYAVGANDSACQYVGIDANKQKLKSFVLCALMCGIAGIVSSSMLNRVSPYMGDATLIDAMTAAMLGATFLRPGVYNIPGTLIGALLVTMMSNGFTILGVPTFGKDLIQGAVFIVAVCIVSILRHKSEKKG